MHVGKTFFQQFSNSVLVPSSINHQVRPAMIRRYCGDRICLLMSVLLAFYILWNVYNTSKPTLRYDYDPAEELAYRKAMNSSSPILENTQLCSSDKIDLIFLIISSSLHFLERQSIRETWGSMPDLFGVRSQRLFVIGYHMGDNSYKDISSEAAHERDLLYLTVNDYLSTLKEMHAYRWLDQHCSNVTYMFKTEDDLIINSLLLHELVRELKTKPNDVKNRVLYDMPLDSMFACQKDQFLFGWAFQPSEPERSSANAAYYVSKEEYSKGMYPQYCSGFGYFMTSQTRRALTTEAFKDQYPFRFPAIFITGILPERLDFVCALIPFTFHQGATDQCIDLIKKNEQTVLVPNPSPLLVCSTARHAGQNTFSDYYKIWTDLKNVYGDKLHQKTN